MNHKTYIGQLCKLFHDPMINVYNEEFLHLHSTIDYENHKFANVIHLSTIKVLSVDQIKEALKPLEDKHQVRTELVEYESNYIEFESPLIKAWVALHLMTNPKERGR